MKHILFAVQFRKYLSRGFFLLTFVLLFISSAFGAVVIDSNVKLTNTTNANNPAWSPDGEKIVYAARQAIWIMNSDGSGQKKLYDGMGWDGEPEFNDDGTKIYFASESKKAFSARYISIHVMDTDGSNGLKLTENADSRAPSLSPHGSKLAYTSRTSGNYDVWTMSLNGADKVRLTDAIGDESSPSWSPDGSTIVYSAMGDIFTIDLNDVRPVQLTEDIYNNVEPDYSPDGKMIAYASDVGGDHDLWILDLAGNSHVKITSDLSSERAPAWSPDGNKIAYVSNREGEFNIWVMNLETEEINFEIADNHAEDNENAVNNEYVKKLRDYAASKPKEFIAIVLLASFGFVVLIVGSFLRKIS